MSLNLIWHFFDQFLTEVPVYRKTDFDFFKSLSQKKIHSTVFLVLSQTKFSFKFTLKTALQNEHCFDARSSSLSLAARSMNSLLLLLTTLSSPDAKQKYRNSTKTIFGPILSLSVLALVSHWWSLFWTWESIFHCMVAIQYVAKPWKQEQLGSTQQMFL